MCSHPLLVPPTQLIHKTPLSPSYHLSHTTPHHTTPHHSPKRFGMTKEFAVICTPSDQGYYEPDTSELIRLKLASKYGYGLSPATLLTDKVNLLGSGAHPFWRWIEGTCRTPLRSEEGTGELREVSGGREDGRAAEEVSQAVPAAGYRGGYRCGDTGEEAAAGGCELEGGVEGCG